LSTESSSTKPEDYTDGSIMDAIRTILLLDPRHSGNRRQISFNRLTDDWAKTQGVLMLKAAPQ